MESEILQNLMRENFKIIYGQYFIYSILPKNRCHLWNVAAPKSGSTWLSSMLQQYLEWQLVALLPCYDRREQEVEPQQILAQGAMNGNIFSPQQHCRFNSNTELFLNATGAKVVLQCRNIFDTVISLRDHYDREGTVGPMVYMDNVNWACLSDAQKLDFILDMELPWFFNFYAGWFSSDIIKTSQVHIVKYEDLLGNPAKVLQDILTFADIEIVPSRINDVIAHSDGNLTRKNKAIIGRGDSLTEQQKNKIYTYSSYYPKIDFSLIGL